MLNKIKNAFIKSAFGNSQSRAQKSYLIASTNAAWMDRNYAQFADEAFIKNVIAHRAISLIAQAAASIPLKLYKLSNSGKIPIKAHSILNLLSSPNPSQSGSEFLEMLYSYRQISGNAFVLAIAGGDSTQANLKPRELYCLRPDRIAIAPGDNFLPNAYIYKVGQNSTEYKVDTLTGQSKILHIKTFHPLSDWYGLSAIEAAAYSIDQHNQAGEWNQALLQNGARPSGAIVVKGNEHDGYPNLSETQHANIKSMIDEVFSGPHNAGRPMLLSGGLDWKEMSLTPKDMDFIESKHSSARDIALAFGVPPQLLGIPGDNTYSNLQEARLALWEQTVIPIAQNVVENLSNWLSNFYGKEYILMCNTDEISALAARREAFWARLETCTFLTQDEKRQLAGFGPLSNNVNSRV